MADWRDLRAYLTQQAMAGLTVAERQHLADAVPALMRLAERLALR